MGEEEDWSNLSRDILEKIGEKIDEFSDYIRFRAVCVTWRSSLPEYPKHLQRRFPCLLLPHSPGNPTPCLLNPLLPELVHHLGLHLPLPFDNLLIRGFSKGWLIAEQEEGPIIYLINPFTNQTHQLPPILDFIEKVVLSSPNPDNFIAMALHGLYNQLSFCRLGDEEWSYVNQQEPARYADVLFCKGKFYAVDIVGGVVVVCDMDSSSPIAVPVASCCRSDCGLGKFYLVEWSYDGDLLLVARFLAEDDDSYRTRSFEVFKLNLVEPETKLKTSSDIKLNCLENHILFLGENESVSLPSRIFPGCKGNLIYFCDDYLDNHYPSKGGGSDFGVFDYKDKSLQSMPGYPYDPKLSLLPSPIWVMRNL